MTQLRRPRALRAEVAKYPPNGSIRGDGLPGHHAQQVSRATSGRAEAAIADHLACRHRRARGDDLLQHVQPAAGQQVQLNVCTSHRASCATARKRWSTSAAGRGRRRHPRADSLFTVQKCECLGACDAPVMLVNDRQMCSYMSHERLTPQAARRHPEAHPRPEPWSTFQVPGPRRGDLLPRLPYRRADLRRPEWPQLAPEGTTSPWRLPPRCARSWARTAAGHDAHQVIAEVKGSRPARPWRRGLPTGLKWSFMPRAPPVPEVPRPVQQDEASRAPAGPRHPHRYNPHIVIEGMAIAALRDGHRVRLQLHPRRDVRRSTSASKRPGRSPRGRLPGRQHPRFEFLAQLHAATASAPTSAARKPRCSNRWKARRASRASTAAVPGQLQPVRQSRPPSQHRDLRGGALDHPATAARSTRMSASRTTAAPRSSRWSGDVEQARATSRSDGHAVRCWNSPAACANGKIRR